MKKLLIVLMCLCLCLPAAFAEESAESKSRIGIISAMENEVKLLLSEAEIERTDTIGGVNFHVGTLCGQNVVIAKAGIGKVLSAAGTATMLNRYPVSYLIFTGIAGGVGDETGKEERQIPPSGEIEVVQSADRNRNRKHGAKDSDKNNAHSEHEHNIRWHLYPIDGLGNGLKGENRYNDAYKHREDQKHLPPVFPPPHTPGERKPSAALFRLHQCLLVIIHT